MNIRDEIREARRRTGFSKSGLAKRAGLGKNQLADMDGDWNPTANTLEALYKILAPTVEQIRRENPSQ